MVGNLGYMLYVLGLALTGALLYDIFEPSQISLLDLPLHHLRSMGALEFHKQNNTTLLVINEKLQQK